MTSPAVPEKWISGFDASQPLATVVAQAAELSQRRGADVWQVISRIGKRGEAPARRPMAESPALTRVFEAHRAELTVSPRAAARNLRAITLAMSHPLLVEQPATPREIAGLFLHGVGKGASC